MISSDRNNFWKDAFTLHGSVTPRVIPYVLAFSLIALGICVFAWFVERLFDSRIGIILAPYEFAGVALGLLLVLRTNAGYDRWWEARVLWGGIVNQTRNLVISSLTYGPQDSQWREQVVRWTAVFPHIARCSLRGQPPSKEVVALVGEEVAKQIETSAHMPGYVAWRLGLLLEEGCQKFGMDRFAFRQIDEQRARLIDHIGGCERILKTPLPIVYAIKIRRFITLYLLALPLALLHQTESVWAILLIPTEVALVAYPLISLDQIGVELQNPFADRNLSHLPLDDISNTIENNVQGFLQLSEEQTAAIPDSQVD
ncbi:bestrophin family protein [Gimesia panareensis]|uniref:Bestrophin, RFP-TM, chloride channel n=1 Tax=Gimesia panareensis TaxID=2527978 RepID=A0A517QC83_9PLAN|nr:bestrophin family ion channel [Gimesia panareensis]QDT29195.1 Bestrophin, RFP-TM, chloride channel [Gimesia panareensis]QDU52047.1 Bestrophin, RFP-TM, chloride channel [Gimesia panareensis]